jgi:hypothetical protein
MPGAQPIIAKHPKHGRTGMNTSTGAFTPPADQRLLAATSLSAATMLNAGGYV